MKYGKTKLLRILSNIPREGWTFQKLKDLVDSLYREEFPRYRCNVHSLTTGTHRIDFLHPFPVGSQYRLEFRAMNGNNLIGSKLSGDPDDTGFSITVTKDCTFDYTATLYY